jgi:hypothetical protein
MGAREHIKSGSTGYLPFGWRRVAGENQAKKLVAETERDDDVNPGVAD